MCKLSLVYRLKIHTGLTCPLSSVRGCWQHCSLCVGNSCTAPVSWQQEWQASAQHSSGPDTFTPTDTPTHQTHTHRCHPLLFRNSLMTMHSHCVYLTAKWAFYHNVTTWVSLCSCSILRCLFLAYGCLWQKKRNVLCPSVAIKHGAFH